MCRFINKNSVFSSDLFEGDIMGLHSDEDINLIDDHLADIFKYPVNKA